MPTLAGRSLFTIGNRSYVWEDLVAAGCLWGDWATLEERVRDGLICLARLDDLDDDDEDGLSEDEVDTAAAEFRYARDLVAADDLEAWLEQRGLAIDGWLDFIRRSLLLERWAEDLDEIREEYEADDDEVSETMVCEAVCGGGAGRLVERPAGRRSTRARPGRRLHPATPSTRRPPRVLRRPFRRTSWSASFPTLRPRLVAIGWRAWRARGGGGGGFPSGGGRP